MKLSHYTDERGLVGIVRSQSFWAREFSALNDTSEFVYAIPALCEEALVQSLSLIPTDLHNELNGPEAVRSALLEGIESFKEQIKNSDGYGSLYVMFFARGGDDLEDKQGILALWDRYTQSNGYCLQFNKEVIHNLVENESIRYSYAFILTAPITYGDGRGSPEFLALVDQLSLRAVRSLFLKSRDPRLATPNLQRIQPETAYLLELLRFLGTHKHPAFEDEREIRIFACPVNITEGRIFTGPAMPKTICSHKTLGRYIALGANLLPGAIPDTILSGPKGKLMPQPMLDALYPAWPKIRKSTIPLR